MGHSVTIGGERLGTGNKKMKAYLHNYERSTHDLNQVWRSSMASGTLVPFLTEVALPGDTFDIDLDVDVLTHPTIGPLFGTYKVQLDIFQIPVRLYQGQLHMNMLGIGLDMSKILLPVIGLTGTPIDKTKPIDNQHVNPSSILSYLGIRGVGTHANDPTLGVSRYFNAVPFLGYWDIYKNYYANKQEEIGYVVHKDPADQVITITTTALQGSNPPLTLPSNPVPPYTYQQTVIDADTTLTITGTGFTDQTDFNQVFLITQLTPIVETDWKLPLTECFENVQVISPTQVICNTPKGFLAGTLNLGFAGIAYDATLTQEYDTEPNAVSFPLANIDQMRKTLLSYTDGQLVTVNEVVDPTNPPNYLTPYSLPFENAVTTPPGGRYSIKFSQEGLALKTYNSDLFNNWIQTEWIDGPDGISAVTAIDTSGGSFTIDELNLSRKIYDMLNRIAISGGSYDDWLDAVYTHERHRSAENPMYLGGLITNLVFQEVISNSATQQQPLGSLAGRGRIGAKRKGGQIIAKVDEPSYIMGIVHITPNIDYSQGNKWDVNLKTMNDFHKPALDQIGFQDLITDQMAWWDTNPGNTFAEPVVFKSAGKQPAWVNYMTAVNYVRGNFADETQQMFMVLNRRYDPKYEATSTTINDLTTYIDPTKFNHIFADTRRDAQNFWVQIATGMTARRKMSAKVMPNL